MRHGLAIARARWRNRREVSARRSNRAVRFCRWASFSLRRGCLVTLLKRDTRRRFATLRRQDLRLVVIDWRFVRRFARNALRTASLRAFD